ncbi:hypothetical protein [Pyrolobus fumarii]|uniref:hypothetical protein n=1 Tax=Pyrolobus fumarii TaxID=54252 RepID=UPI00143336B3|nr:hypothetical protein [Pyrolobus fumarii]
MTLEEARWYSIERLSRETGLGIDALRDLLGRLALLEERAVNALAETGVNVDEVNPVVLKNDTVYSGDWVGVATFTFKGSLYTIVVRPKISWFDDMVQKALGVLARLGAGSVYAKLEAAIASAGAIRLPGALLASMFIEEWARSHPITPRNLATLAYMTYAATASVTKMLAKLQVPMAVRIPASAPLLALASNPLVAQSLHTMPTEEPHYEPVEEAALLARASTVQLGSLAYNLTMLLPAPKLFELAVLAEILDVMHRERGCKTVKIEDWTLILDCRDTEARIYYNKSPRSRLIERLVGTRLKPDTVIETDDELLIVEAKYRRCDSHLGIGDAVRIAAYMYDLDPNTLIIVYPECVKTRHVNEKVVIVPFNELKERLEQLL